MAEKKGQSSNPQGSQARPRAARSGHPIGGVSEASRDMENGGDEGIRTLDILLRYTPLAGERLQPLGHVSTIAFARNPGFWQGRYLD